MNDPMPYIAITIPKWTATFRGGPWDGVHQSGSGEPPQRVWLEQTLRFFCSEEGAELEGYYDRVSSEGYNFVANYAWIGPAADADGQYPVRKDAAWEGVESL